MSRLSQSCTSLALLIALSAGCASDRAPAVKAVASLSDTRTELLAGRESVDAAVARLGEIEARPADLRPAYQNFKNAIEAVENRAEAVSDQVADMRERSADYRATWSEENARISDPGLRETADQRRQRVVDQYNEIDRGAQELRPAYDAFVKQLRDIETVLTNDLTYNGVEAARPGFESARSSAADLRQRIDSLVNDLDQTSTRLSPTTQQNR